MTSQQRRAGTIAIDGLRLVVSGYMLTCSRGRRVLLLLLLLVGGSDKGLLMRRAIWGGKARRGHDNEGAAATAGRCGGALAASWSSRGMVLAAERRGACRSAVGRCRTGGRC